MKGLGRVTTRVQINQQGSNQRLAVPFGEMVGCADLLVLILVTAPRVHLLVSRADHDSCYVLIVFNS